MQTITFLKWGFGRGSDETAGCGESSLNLQCIKSVCFANVNVHEHVQEHVHVHVDSQGCMHVCVCMLGIFGFGLEWMHLVY